MLQQCIKTEKDMLALGGKLAKTIQPGLCIALYGELGAGKTTFVRGFLRSLGFKEAVKSPTYTLVETYTIKQQRIHHFDLYRLVNSEELEFMGIRDYFNEMDVNLVEWPMRGKGYLPLEDLSYSIVIRELQRDVTIKANTPAGMRVLTMLAKEGNDEA